MVKGAASSGCSRVNSSTSMVGQPLGGTGNGATGTSELVRVSVGDKIYVPCQGH